MSWFHDVQQKAGQVQQREEERRRVVFEVVSEKVLPLLKTSIEECAAQGMTKMTFGPTEYVDADIIASIKGAKYKDVSVYTVAFCDVFYTELQKHRDFKGFKINKVTETILSISWTP